MIQETQRDHTVEEARERQAVYKDSQSVSIEMNNDKVETIRTAMKGFTLPAIPSWAENLSESEWQKVLSEKLTNKK